MPEGKFIPVHQRWRHGLVVLLLLLGVWPAPLARASCIAGPPLAEAVATADTVFIGTVLATTNEGRLARVRVDAVWRGGPLPAVVVVNGRYAGPGLPPAPAGEVQWSSVDRSYTVGERYLFLPHNGVSPFEDVPCTSTRLYTPDLDRYAPAAVRTPDPRLPTPPPFLAPTPAGGRPPGENVGPGSSWLGCSRR